MAECSAEFVGDWIPLGPGTSLSGRLVGINTGMITIPREAWKRMWHAEQTLAKAGIDQGAAALLLADLDRLRERIVALAGKAA